VTRAIAATQQLVSFCDAIFFGMTGEWVKAWAETVNH
jgi:hypothetical protein